MEPELLPAPADLWWSGVVSAALHGAGLDVGPTTVSLPTLVVRCDQPDGSWLAMQRCRGDRFVLWGRSPHAPPAPGDVRREAPDWALSEPTEAGRPTFLAWFAHGEWDAATVAGEVPALLLRPWLSVDPQLARLAADGRLDVPSLAARAPGAAGAPGLEAAVAAVREARREPAPLARGSVRGRLLDQVHRQMREASEADRMLLQQPPELVRWARAQTPGSAFVHAVILRRGQMSPAPTNTALPRSVRGTLRNVLEHLHRQEASEERGAWLFARVRSDGEVVRLDRAFDHWPSWWRVASPAQGHSLADLTWEIEQRGPAWRPAWSALLPVPVR